MLLRRSLALLSLTLPLACAGSTTTGDSRGSAGGAGDAATGDAETDAKPSDGTTTDADFNTIAECESDVELVYEYYTHSASYAPGEPVDWDPVGFREMLQALSERRPGKYRIKVSYSRGLDFESSTFVLMAGDTGSATYVWSHYYSDYHSGGGTAYWPAQECELQPPSFFEACMADDESLKSCADPSVRFGELALAWLVSCSPTEAVCQ